MAREDYAQAAALKEELAALGPAAAAPARPQPAATPGGPAARVAAAADTRRPPSAPGTYGMYDRLAAGGRR